VRSSARRLLHAAEDAAGRSVESRRSDGADCGIDQLNAHAALRAPIGVIQRTTRLLCRHPVNRGALNGDEPIVRIVAPAPAQQNSARLPRLWDGLCARDAVYSNGRLSPRFDEAARAGS
jgi:hypothetical protein